MPKKAEKRALSPDTAASDPPSRRKRSRKSMGQKDTADKKTALVWNKRDELTILQAHVHCIKNGVAFPKNINPIMEGVKGSIEHDVTYNQMYEKFRSLRRKYESTLEKIVTPHFQYKDAEEEQIFHISHCIWGEPNAEGQQPGHLGNPGVQDTEVSFAEVIEETKIVMAKYYSDVKSLLARTHAFTKEYMEDYFNTISTRNSRVAIAGENQENQMNGNEMEVALSHVLNEVGPLMTEFFKTVKRNLEKCYTCSRAMEENGGNKRQSKRSRRYFRRLQTLHENAERHQSLRGEANYGQLE